MESPEMTLWEAFSKNITTLFDLQAWITELQFDKETACTSVWAAQTGWWWDRLKLTCMSTKHIYCQQTPPPSRRKKKKDASAKMCLQHDVIQLVVKPFPPSWDHILLSDEHFTSNEMSLAKEDTETQADIWHVKRHMKLEARWKNIDKLCPTLNITVKRRGDHHGDEGKK